MRPRGSITGPLIIILLGVVFLIHAISPEFPLIDWMGLYWPYLLIVWGAVALLEVCFRVVRGSPIPTNGVSGGSWFAIILICLFGFSIFEFHDRDMWWQHADWSRGFDNAFGDEHQFSIKSIQRNVGMAPHVVIESFRGDAKITGVDGTNLTLAGHKTIRASRDEMAERSNAQTPVDVSTEGNTVVIRSNQNRAGYRTGVTTNLELSIPKGASVEINGTSGDLDVSSLTGDVAIRSGNAGVRLQDLGGNLTVDTRRSDLIRCSGVKGSIDLRGHGSDVELEQVDGEVTMSGEYTGTVSLERLTKPARIQNSRTELEVASIPGQMRLDRGSLNIENAVGPLKVNAHSTDVTLDGVSNALDISVDRGDIDLKPERLPFGSIAVHSGSGNIQLALPLRAQFVLTATTNHGEIENEYGDSLKEQTSGRGARLEGSVGSGPNVDLVTGRGSITLRKSGEAARTSAATLIN